MEWTRHVTDPSITFSFPLFLYRPKRFHSKTMEQVQQTNCRCPNLEANYTNFDIFLTLSSKKYPTVNPFKVPPSSLHVPKMRRLRRVLHRKLQAIILRHCQIVVSKSYLKRGFWFGNMFIFCSFLLQFVKTLPLKQVPSRWQVSCLINFINTDFFYGM